MITPQKKMQMIELAAHIEDLQNNWGQQLEIYALVAKTKKAHYDAFVEAGFSASDALMLVK